MLRLVQGIGVGGEMPVAAVYINELSKAQRARAVLPALRDDLSRSGLMVTGQIGAVLVPTFGWQVMFLIGGIPGLIITRAAPAAARVAALADLEGAGSPRPRRSSARSKRSTDPSACPPSAADADQRDETGAAAPVAQRGSAGPSCSRRAYRRRTLVVWTLWASAYFITNGLNNWMPTLYNRVYGLSLEQALRAGTLTNVAQVVILLGCALVIDRIGRRRGRSSASSPARCCSPRWAPSPPGRWPP